MEVGQDLVSSFENDGAVCVRGIASDREVEQVAAAIDEVLAQPSDLALIASRPDDELFFEDFCNWQRIRGLEEFITTSAVSQVAAQLMGATTVRLFHDHVLVKEKGTSQRTPWHQDQPYYNVDGRMNVSMWMPVDAVDRATTLEFVAGSHHGPWFMPRTFLDAEARWFPEGTLAELPDIDRDPDHHTILGWELEPGDAVFFHMLTLHAAGGSAAARRRVLSVRMLGDDMVFAPRPWRTSPPFEGLDRDLEAGAPLDHPLVPTLWSEQ